MAADGGCGETVDQYNAEVERLTQELAEANREKIRAAECGLVVLEENQALKQKYADLEFEQEALRTELEQLQEVRGFICCLLCVFVVHPTLLLKALVCVMWVSADLCHPQQGQSEVWGASSVG